MFNVGDYVVYNRNICKVSKIAPYTFNSSVSKQFYVLNPIEDMETRINIPVEQLNCSIRKIISKEETEKLINDIPNIEMIDVKNDKNIEKEYEILFRSEDHHDWIKIIKTTYMRNQNRLLSGKKIGERDDKYFKSAEKQLYSELALSLGKTYDETRKYVVEKVESLSI